MFPLQSEGWATLVGRDKFAQSVQQTSHSSYALCPLRKKSSSDGPPRLTSFSASCSSRLKKGSLSGSVCADPDVLAPPGVGWSYGVGMLSMGSNATLESSWLWF